MACESLEFRHRLKDRLELRLVSQNYGLKIMKNRFAEKFSLIGKTAVITGASGMLGQKHTLALLELGATVVMTDINIKSLIDFHSSHKKLATITGVVPPGRYGAIVSDGDIVKSFEEKPRGDGGIINGGYFVLSPKVIDLIDGDETSWELDPLHKLVDEENLMVFKHNGFWQPMDTLRDKNYLEELWATNPPWKSWS